MGSVASLNRRPHPLVHAALVLRTATILISTFGTMVSPGLKFLALNAPGILLPSVLLYIGSRVLERQSSGALPRWSIIPLATVLLSVITTLHREWCLFRDRRKAASIGAVIPPLLPDKWPFHLRTLLVMLESIRNGYPGKT